MQCRRMLGSFGSPHRIDHELIHPTFVTVKKCTHQQQHPRRGTAWSHADVRCGYAACTGDCHRTQPHASDISTLAHVHSPLVCSAHACALGARQAPTRTESARPARAMRSSRFVGECLVVPGVPMSSAREMPTWRRVCSKPRARARQAARPRHRRGLSTRTDSRDLRACRPTRCRCDGALTPRRRPAACPCACWRAAARRRCRDGVRH